MSHPVQGLHHVTVMAADAQRNVDFYSVLLGQRMVKVTVNFDDPGTYHLYYGDRVGSPGTIMTHFPWPGAKRGVRGNGEVVATAYSMPSVSAAYWKDRLGAAGFAVQERTRFGQTVLAVEDPDGTWVELVADDGRAVPQPWPDAPVPQEHALRGFHSVTAWVNDANSVRALLATQLGFTEEGQEPDGAHTRFRFRGAGAGVGLYVDVVERPGEPRGTFGAGSVHHVALRTVDDAEQAEYLTQLTAAGYRPTPVQDRQYFHSIYFRDRSGVLFEIATDAPGFADDEAEADLGHTLKLPAWFEDRRADIERHLPPLTNREHGTVTGGAGHRAAIQAATVPADAHTLRAGRPLGQARVAMILVHGRGGSAEELLSLAEHWNQSAYAYLAPQAPGGSHDSSAPGSSWYPQSFLAPVEQNQPALDESLTRIGALLDELAAAGIPAERVMLGGFSQGACLVGEYVARHPRRYGGLFLLSGALITLSHPGDLQGTPVFMGNSDRDAHIPHERFARSASVLAAMNAQVDARVYPGMPHTIVQDELDAVGRLMQALALESV